MPQSSAMARRYADAFFSLARDAGDIEAWGRDLRRAAEVLGNHEVAGALSNPRLNIADRTRLALELLEGVSDPTQNLVRLLLERRRIALLPQIVERYGRLADLASGIVRAEVTTAVDVDEGTKKEIARVLEEKLGTPVKTHVSRDPEILGGLVVRIGDRVIDDSVRTHLQQLQAALA